ncbi:MAG: type IV pilus secretin PilQ [Desulfobacteraceae bacterium]
MNRLQTSLPQKHVFFIILAFALIVLNGCVAGKTDTPAPAENEPEKTQQEISESSDKKTVLEDIRVSKSDGSVSVLLQGNRKIEYTSIKQSFPFGIAIYMPETEFADNLDPALPENSNINDILLSFADENKKTAKLLILLDDNVSYDVEPLNESELMVKIPQKAATTAQTETEGGEEGTENNLENDATIKNTVEPSDIPEGPAELTGIEFTTDKQGYTDISVNTSQPVKYDIQPRGENTLVLYLVDTNIPERHQRPFLAKYFKSAVDRLIPSQDDSSLKNKNSRIEIEMRENVPYRLVQTRQGINLHFEPSGVQPPEFAKAQKLLNEGASVTADTETKNDQELETDAKQNKSEDDQDPEDIYDEKKQYTGRKVKLDFYETDIKNVFRILRQVSNENFAVDKDVTGNVTLSLEKPVPWDQVLDLVLKMNGLGKTKENNVIRIATLETLQKEEDRRQQRIAARKREQEQKKDMEPLITEYIPVNYSSASADIKPHLENIQTEDRGTISVDERTNMIIMTDTREKIEQAREIIYRLDKVTPQIMIKAKVVEATKDFERDLGIAWGLGTDSDSDHEVGDVYSSSLGHGYSWDVAVNYPAAAASDLVNFTLDRFAGADLVLNASLTAAESKGDIKIISSPKILTLDNKPAQIKQGLEYPYLERDDTGGSTVKFKDIDLLLEVTPHVTPDDRISMKLHLTKNDVNTIVDGVPSLSTNEAETELLVNNDDTIVIGGVVKNTITESRSGIPYLSDIPLLGKAFRRDQKGEDKQELLIFLTPSIVQLEQKRE